MPFIIQKSSRARENPTALNAYSASTCIEAGIEPGKIYDCRDEAQRDADRLTKYNPVGFVVTPLSDTN